MLLLALSGKSSFQVPALTVLLVKRLLVELILRPRVTFVLLVKSRLLDQHPVVLIAMRVKLLPPHFPRAPIVLWGKRVPLVLTVLRRALPVKLHPVVPPRVPFVLQVKSRLQHQHPVVPIVLRVKVLPAHLRPVPLAPLREPSV